MLVPLFRLSDPHTHLEVVVIEDAVAVKQGGVLCHLCVNLSAVAVVVADDERVHFATPPVGYDLLSYEWSNLSISFFLLIVCKDCTALLDKILSNVIASKLMGIKKG